MNSVGLPVPVPVLCCAVLCYHRPTTGKGAWRCVYTCVRRKYHYHVYCFRFILWVTQPEQCTQWGSGWVGWGWVGSGGNWELGWVYFYRGNREREKSVWCVEGLLRSDGRVLGLGGEGGDWGWGGLGLGEVKDRRGVILDAAPRAACCILLLSSPFSVCDAMWLTSLRFVSIPMSTSTSTSLRASLSLYSRPPLPRLTNPTNTCSACLPVTTWRCRDLCSPRPAAR